MATVSPAVYGTPMSPMSDKGKCSTSQRMVKGLNLHNSTGPSTLPKPPYDSALANWHNYNTNKNVNTTFNNVNPVPSPPSTSSSFSARSSPTSSPPAEPATQSLSSPSPVYFNLSKPRSKSMAIPVPAPCCSNCGLRRPSTSSDPTVLPVSGSAKNSTRPRPHLPLHLHCPEPCPDTILPSVASTSPTLPHNRQRHHRRRSSLCYAESLVDDAGTIDNGFLPLDVKQTWERQAENIAKKVVLRKPSPDTAAAFENAIIED